MKYEDLGRRLRHEYRWTAVTTLTLGAACFALFLLALGYLAP